MRNGRLAFRYESPSRSDNDLHHCAAIHRLAAARLVGWRSLRFDLWDEQVRPVPCGVLWVRLNFTTGCSPQSRRICDGVEEWLISGTSTLLYDVTGWVFQGMVTNIFYITSVTSHVWKDLIWNEVIFRFSRLWLGTIPGRFYSSNANIVYLQQ